MRATGHVGRADQRRVLRHEARDLRLDRAGRRARRGDVREADPARRGRGVHARRVLRADGHDQGPAAARGAATTRVVPRGSASASTQPNRPSGDALRSALRAARAAPARARDRRAFRRPRDRLRRHDPRAHPREPGPRGGLGRPRRRGRARRTRHAASAEVFLAAPAASRSRCIGFRDGYLPHTAAEVKDAFEELKDARRAGSRAHAHARRPPPGPPARLRADVEHVPGPPDPRIRDPEVGRRPRAAERLRPLTEEFWCRRSSTCSAAHFDTPARQALVRRRGVPRADAPPGDGVPRARAATPRRSSPEADPRTEGGGRVVKVLVTGSAGYIGSVLCPILVRPRATTSSASTPATTTAATSARTPASVRRLDRRRARRAAEHLDGFDAVVHLAALSNDPLGDLSPELTHEINHRGDARVARAAKSAGVRRFVFASSCSMYGASDADAAARRGCAAAPAHGLCGVEGALRGGPRASSTATGSRPSRCGTRRSTACRRGSGWTSCSTTSPAWSHVTGRIRLLSDGMSWRPLLHVRDLAKVALRMVEAPASLVAGKRVQHRLRRAELPRTRPGGDPRRGDGLRRRVRGRRVARPALVPRRLLGAGTGLSRPRARLERTAGRRGAHRRIPRASASPKRRSRGARTSGSGSSAISSTSTSSMTTCAGSRR